jgi:hypothetical protein
MLRLINGPVEVLRKDEETQNFPICDNSGFTIGSAETYGHALEITEAVSNYNRVVKLLEEAKRYMGSRGLEARKVQREIDRFLEEPALTS